MSIRHILMSIRAWPTTRNRSSKMSSFNVNPTSTNVNPSSINVNPSLVIRDEDQACQSRTEQNEMDDNNIIDDHEGFESVSPLSTAVDHSLLLRTSRTASRRHYTVR